MDDISKLEGVAAVSSSQGELASDYQLMNHKQKVKSHRFSVEMTNTTRKRRGGDTKIE